MPKTRLELQTATAYRLLDVNQAIWSAAEIQSYIKEGYDNLCIRTGILWLKASPAGMDDVAGQALYDLPTDFYALERVTWDARRLTPLTARQLREMDYSYESTAGDVYAYTIEQDGIQKLRKVRIPSVTQAGRTSIEYQRRGAALTADSTTVELPDRYAKYLVWFACWKALARDSPGQQVELAEHYRQRYELGVARIQARKGAVRRSRLGRLGGTAAVRYSGPPRPRLPWNFPER